MSHRRTGTLLLVLSLSTGIIACSSDSTPQTTPTVAAPTVATSNGATDNATVAPPVTGAPETPSSEPGSDTSVDGTTSPFAEGGPTSAPVDALTAAGISIVAREDQPVDTAVTDAGHLMVTSVQARRLVADVSPEAGMLGADIDAMIALPPEVPPLSYIVAGWVSQGASPSSATARSWMGTQDWSLAPTVRFPMAVLAMFVAEMSIGTAAELAPLEMPLVTPTGDDVQTGPHGRAAPSPQQLAGGPCTAVTQFISQSITGIFNALRIVPPSGGGVLVVIGQVLSGVVNFALDIAQGIVQGLVDAVTAPVLNLIAIAIGALGVVTVVASFFKDNNLSVRIQPASNTQFSIDGEPDNKGEFIATAKDLTGDWPAVLKDCAQASGTTLPELLPVGNPVTWEVEDKGLITTGPRSGAVDSERTARLTFVAGHESKEAREKGAASTDGVIAKVRIPRKELDTILDFARSKLNDAQASILNKVPAPLRAVTTNAVNSVIKPTLDQLQAEASGAASGVFSLTGQATLFVLHHATPETTTSSSTPPTADSAPPDTGDEGDFCTQYLALVAFAQAGPDDVVTWATEIVDRLQTMRPVAPAELLGDVDVTIRVYSAVAASADVLVLIQTTEPLPDAAARLGAFCGLTPG